MPSSLDLDVGLVEVDAAPKSLFPSAFTVDGTLHTVNSMSLEAGQSLQHWDTYLTQLGRVVKLLSQEWARMRFINDSYQYWNNLDEGAPRHRRRSSSAAP